MSAFPPSSSAQRPTTYAGTYSVMSEDSNTADVEQIFALAAARSRIARRRLKLRTCRRARGDAVSRHIQSASVDVRRRRNVRATVRVPMREWRRREGGRKGGGERQMCFVRNAELGEISFVDGFNVLGRAIERPRARTRRAWGRGPFVELLR